MPSPKMVRKCANFPSKWPGSALLVARNLGAFLLKIAPPKRRLLPLFEFTPLFRLKFIVSGKIATPSATLPGYLTLALKGNNSTLKAHFW